MNIYLETFRVAKYAVRLSYNLGWIRIMNGTMQLSDWSDWSLIVKRNSPSVTSMNHHNSLVGYLAIQILPVLQIFKLQHTVQALVLHLDNNKGCSFILKGLMSLRSEDGTQYNLLALFSSPKLMMSYLLDYID